MDVPTYDDREGRREKMPPGAPKLPTIEVVWHQETKSVGVKFETEEFRNWDFVVAVLGMAKDQAEFQRRQAQMDGLRRAEIAEQQQQLQAAQTAKRIALSKG